MNVKERLVADQGRIITLYNSGHSIAEIAKEYECSDTYIRTLFKNCGIEARENHHKYDHLIPQALEKFSNGQSINSVAKDLGIPYSTLNNIIKKNGYDTSKFRVENSAGLDDYKYNIIDSYKSGNSQSEIARLQDCHSCTVSRFLKKQGIEARTRQYHCNHSFFDVIDSEEKAYCLGLFCADGHRGKNNVFQITMADLDILEKIKKVMDFTGPISIRQPPEKYPHRKILYKIEITSEQICSRLGELGYPTNKTFVTRFPSAEEVPSRLLVHFIRGVHDGDGSLYGSGNAWTIKICGTHTLLEPMRQHIYYSTGIMMGIYKNHNIFDILINAKWKIGRILDWLYKDATIYMDRKYKKYLEYVESCSLSTKEKANALSTSK